MKTTKGGKVMNPTDAYRKELRKKELKRNKKERKKVREVGILKKDPEAIRDQIRKLETMKADGALDKTRRHKKRQLEDTLNLVMKKRKEYEEKMREKGEEPIMFSHLSAPRRTADEELKAKQMNPEDSIYFHPTLNPTGAPPPGKPPMYKSNAGSSNPLSEDGDMDTEMTIPIPPPPPLPMAEGGTSAEEATMIPLSVPVPPPPPAPPRPGGSTAPSLPLPPPPPPGPPPKVRSQILLPPPPPHRQLQPPPPGTGAGTTIGILRAVRPSGIDDTNEKMSGSAINAHDWVSPPTQEGKTEQKNEESQDNKGVLPPPERPPPPPQLLVQKPVSSLPLPPPPPPLGMMRSINSHEILPPGSISRLPPPPPPPGLRPPPPPPLTGQSFPRMIPNGIPMVPSQPLGLPLPPLPPSLTRPPIGMPGAPLMPMPPRVVSMDSNPSLDEVGKASLKTSFVKSAAPTVVKRPLAQHTPELTSMVPASVLVRRESVNKAKPKSSMASSHAVVNIAKISPAHPIPKPQSIDDSYSAFMDDMKALGAFDGDFS